jgi:hypothetical protein
LPRPERSSWLGLLIAIAAVLVAIVGNAIMNPQYLGVFMDYFLPALLVVIIMLNRTLLLRVILNVMKYIFEPIQNFVGNFNKSILKKIDDINSQEFVYFTKDDDVETLNKVMLYIKKNEHTKKLKIVSAVNEGYQTNEQFLTDIDVLDREYPSVKIEFITIEAKFGPELIYRLSEKWDIPVNFMFIGSPGDHFPYRIEELGGVRLII